MLHGDYSSALTGLYKYVLPPAWIGIFGWATLQLFINPESVTFNGVRGGAPPSIEWLFLVMWVLGATMFLALAARLRWIRVLDGVLHVSGLRGETRVLPRSIRAVGQVPLLRPVLIRIVFATDSERERTVWFLPAFKWPSGALADPDLVEQLRALARDASAPAA